MKKDILEKKLQNVIKSFEIENLEISQEHISVLKKVAYGKISSSLLIIERKKTLLKG